jgi:hypothetical protein
MGNRSSCENNVANSIWFGGQMIPRHEPRIPRILNLHLLHKLFRVYELSSGKTSFLEFVICAAGSTTNSGNLAPGPMGIVFQHNTTI